MVSPYHSGVTVAVYAQRWRSETEAFKYLGDDIILAYCCTTLLHYTGHTPYTHLLFITMAVTAMTTFCNNRIRSILPILLFSPIFIHERYAKTCTFVGDYSVIRATRSV